MENIASYLKQWRLGRSMLRPYKSVTTVAVAVEVDEADEWRFIERNSLPGGDFVQRVVNVRQMICGDVADESAHDFLVAHAAMQPAEEQHQLDAD